MPLSLRFRHFAADLIPVPNPSEPPEEVIIDDTGTGMCARITEISEAYFRENGLDGESLGGNFKIDNEEFTQQIVRDLTEIFSHGAVEHFTLESVVIAPAGSGWSTVTVRGFGP